MSVIISARNLEIKEKLRSFTTQEINSLVEKYFGKVKNSTVIFSCNSPYVKVSITINLGNHFSIHSEGENGDSNSCFIKVLHKLERQIIKYKNRLRKKARHQHDELKTDLLSAPKYIIDPSIIEKDEEHQEEELSDPIVISESESPLLEMTVTEAAMMLDLSSDHLLVFVNNRSGNINIVHKRNDGNIGWIDPALQKKA